MYSSPRLFKLNFLEIDKIVGVAFHIKSKEKTHWKMTNNFTWSRGLSTTDRYTCTYTDTVINPLAKQLHIPLAFLPIWVIFFSSILEEWCDDAKSWVKELACWSLRAKAMNQDFFLPLYFLSETSGGSKNSISHLSLSKRLYIPFSAGFFCHSRRDCCW